MLRFSQAPKGVIELRADRCMLPKSSGILSPASPLPRSASGFAAAGAETRPSSRPASHAFPAHFPEVSHPLPTAGLLSCPFPPAPSTQQIFGAGEQLWRGSCWGNIESEGEINPITTGAEILETPCSDPAALEEPGPNMALAISGCWQLFLALTPRSVLFSHLLPCALG